MCRVLCKTYSAWPSGFDAYCVEPLDAAAFLKAIQAVL